MTDKVKANCNVPILSSHIAEQISRTQLRFRYEDCASCCHRAFCLSVSEFARMAVNKRAGRVGIWACSRSCTVIWDARKASRNSCILRNIKDILSSTGFVVRKFQVITCLLDTSIIITNSLSLRQCDYYGLRSQNITKYFCELLQEVDGRISFYCCLYRYLWQFTTAGWQLIR